MGWGVLPECPGRAEESFRELVSLCRRPRFHPIPFKNRGSETLSDLFKMKKCGFLQAPSRSEFGFLFAQVRTLMTTLT